MAIDIDIKIVGAISQDFSHKRIEVFNLYGEKIWSNYYNNEKYFNKIFRRISKEFSEELHRRELEIFSNNKF